MDAKTEARIFGYLGIGLALFGIAAPYWWPKTSPIISVLCLIIAGFCILIAIYLMIPKKYIIIITSPVRRINKMWLIVGMVIGGVIFIYCAIAYFSNLPTKSPPKQPTAEEIASEVAKKLPINKSIPSTGNLKQRAIDLSDEIMFDLYLHGWPQRYPIDKKYQWKLSNIGIQKIPDDSKGWVAARSAKFRMFFYDKVFAIRNEFSQLHLRDQHLDDFIKHQIEFEDTNKQRLAQGQSQLNIHILPQEIEEAAESLRKLADQIKE